MIEQYHFHHKQQHVGIIIFKWLFVVIGCYLLLVILPEQLKTMHIIEDDFRVRVIANSNTVADQQQKHQIAKEVEEVLEIYNVHETTQKVQLSKYIKQQYPQVEMSIVFGKHLFPPKFEYGKFTSQNYYHSLVVSIGNARGDNWWCTVFKKVCEKDVDDKKKEPVTFWLWEWLKDKFR